MTSIKKTSLVLIAAEYMILSMICGCTDNPEDKSTKVLNQKTTSVLEEYRKDRDIPAGQKKLEQVTAGIRPGTPSSDTAFYSSCRFSLAVLEQDKTQLPFLILAINKNIENFDLLLERYSSDLAESDRIKNLVALCDQEISDLEKWIGSEQDTASLKGKIKAVELTCNQLQEQKAGLEKEYEQTQGEALKFQNQADEYMRQAELASGEKRVELEKAGFALMEQRKAPYLKAQEAQNNLSICNSQLAIESPHLARLKADMEKAETKLQNLKISPSRDNLHKQQGEIALELDKQKAELKLQLEQISIQVNEYIKKTEELASAADGLTEKLKRVNSRQLEPNIHFSLAKTYFLAGSIYAARIDHTANMGAKIENILRTYESYSPEGLTITLSSKPDAELVKKAIDYFNLAATTYGETIALTGQLGTSGKMAACAALKAQMLAIDSKMHIADQINDFDTSEKAQAEIDQLTEKGKEYGTLFSQSAMVSLLNKGLDYIPLLPIDTTMVLDGLKAEFAAWRKLQGTAAETEVAKLLQRITELKADYPGDEQINQFLAQEQQDIDKAKARGFTVESPADANSVNTNTGAPAAPGTPGQPF